MSGYALTGAAPTIGLLLAARLLQGGAGGLLIPQNSGLIQELFQGDERGPAFGILGATLGRVLPFPGVGQGGRDASLSGWCARWIATRCCSGSRYVVVNPVRVGRLT